MTLAFAELHGGDGTARGRVARATVAALCAGHFPGDPFVPGAYLLGLMVEVGARALAVGAAPALAEVVRCTFLAPVRPEGDVVVTARSRRGARVESEVAVGGRAAARALLRFREDA